MQRELEQRGIPTVSVSVARDVTEAIRPPRALFLPFPMGHHFGPPRHRELQRRVVLAALSLLETATESATLATFETTWAEARREAKRFDARDERV